MLTTCFVKYLGSMLMDFNETSITGILLMRLLKISCIWKTYCIILCFLHSIYTNTYIHVNVSDNYLLVPNAGLTFGQMYPHPGQRLLVAKCDTTVGQVDIWSDPG